MADALSLHDETPRPESLARSRSADATLDERFERITRLARRLMDTPIAIVSLFAANRRWSTCEPDLDESFASRCATLCARTIVEDDLLVVRDARRDARFAGNPLATDGAGVGFFAGCPLRGPDGSVLGTLCVADTGAKDVRMEDGACLRDLAAIAQGEFATAMQAALRDDLMDQIGAERRRAMVDPLTRLWNRDGIVDIMDRECGRLRRAGSACAVVMADVDHFKEINDAHGHPVGDEVLCEISGRIERAVRDIDAVGRYGGEEFLISLGSSPDARCAVEIAEGIRASVCESPVRTKAGPIRVTLTLGVAFAPPGGPCCTELLIDAADRALYAGKRNGRNRVECSVCGPGRMAA
jgi:diguanylate cyclase (GGDEF)-like protein